MPCGGVVTLSVSRDAGSATSSARSSKIPTLITSPALSTARFTATLLTWMPLVLIRSWMVQPSASRRRAAWRRDTEKSGSTISFSLPRPRRISSPLNVRISG